MFAKTKIQNFDSEAPHTKLLTLTGILWLKYMSATYYIYFTQQGILFTGSGAELLDFL